MIAESWLEDASGYRGTATRLASPSNAVEIATLLGDCSGRGECVTVAGAGTGVTGGRCPHGGLILSTERLTRLELHDGKAFVGAGVSLADLHAAAARTGQMYPPDPTEWSASVGGSIATNASGSRSFLYGSTRRWIRALTVALMDGTVRTFRRGERIDFSAATLPAPRARKHTAGYYLREPFDGVDLFCGSEGTLGVVVEAELGLLPAPGQLLTGVVFFAGEAEALAAAGGWRSVPQLRMLEYFDLHSIEMLRGRYGEMPGRAGAALLVEQILDGLPGDAVEAWIDRMEAAAGLEESWFGQTPADRERFRVFRHTLPELVNERVRRLGHGKLGTDFAVPVENDAAMMAAYRERLEAEFKGSYVIFGHIGDAHVHVNLLPGTPAQAERAPAVLRELAAEAVRLGGTVSAEHGLGKKKAHLLALEYTAEQIGFMCGVKQRFDPQWLLGRGTLLPVPVEFLNTHC
jgi:FAD/FMN-containing dehydrogenase